MKKFKKVVLILILVFFPLITNAQITNADVKKAKNYLQHNLPQLTIEKNQVSKQGELGLIYKQQDNKATGQHFFIKRYFNNIPVFGNGTIFHKNANNEKKITGLNRGINLNIKSPVFSEEQSKSNALNFYNQNNTNFTLKEQKAELIIYPQDNLDDRLAWEVKITGTQNDTGYINYTYIIDAENGEELISFSNVYNAAATGTGHRYYDEDGDAVEFTTDYDGASTYTLEEPDENLVVSSFNNYDFYGDVGYEDVATFFTNDSTDWDEIDNPKAIEMAYNSQIVYDYFYENFSRQGYDDANGEVHYVIDYGDEVSNAMAIYNYSDDYSLLVFGDGDTEDNTDFYGSLDIAAHELTHLITAETAGFVYKNESGALNEAMSDIFGTMTEQWAHDQGLRDSSDWIGGGEAKLEGYRDLSAPDIYNFPEHLMHYYVTSNDSGGVHTNLSIGTYAFYLLSEGGTNKVTDISVEGISKEKAALIFYHALTDGYTQYRDGFYDYSLATYEVADDLIASGEITENDKLELELAWASVGVSNEGFYADIDSSVYDDRARTFSIPNEETIDFNLNIEMLDIEYCGNIEIGEILLDNSNLIVTVEDDLKEIDSKTDEVEFNFTIDSENLNPGDRITMEIPIITDNYTNIFHSIIIEIGEKFNSLSQNKILYGYSNWGEVSAEHAIGDINNDGYDDIIVGDRSADVFGTMDGVVSVSFGSEEIDESKSLTYSDVFILGQNSRDYFGSDVSIVGDINNDGIDDLGISASGNDDGGYLSGSVHIFFGKDVWDNQFLADEADIIITGKEEYDTINKVDNAGDINNDGIDDLIIGAMNATDSTGVMVGSAYIIYGAEDLDQNISVADADVSILASSLYSYFGNVVTSLGDINNDGIDDLGIGAPQNSGIGADNGEVYILYGDTNLNSEILSTDLDIIITGETEEYADFITNIGDINNDSINDFAIGAPFHDYNEEINNSGVVYIFYGGESLDSSFNTIDADVIIRNFNDGDYFGESITKTGDINNDGIDDIAIGASGSDLGGLDSGEVYLFYGDEYLESEYNADDIYLTFSGSENDNVGRAISGAGDINNDGSNDLVISAPKYDSSEYENAGGLYIVDNIYDYIEISNETVSEQELEALEAFYDKTNGDGWINNDNWLDEENVEDWYGVTVDDGAVTKIELSENNITGSLPSKLVYLTELNTLDLSSNELSDELPYNIGDMANLMDVNLSGNALTGNVKSDLGNLSNLVSLDLSDNDFENSIPTSLAKLSNLETLNLSSNQLTGDMPYNIGDLTSLTYLDLSNNQIENNIKWGIGDLTNLTYLNLSSNLFSDTIPTSLGNLTALNYLDLSSNQLSGKIPSQLNNLVNLYEEDGLDIRYNSLYSEGVYLTEFLNQRQIGNDWESYQTFFQE